MTSSSTRPLQLHKSGVPYIYFDPYSRAEAVYLVTQCDPPMPEAESATKQEDLKKIYIQFAITVYDSVIAATASTSIDTFKNLCERLWPRFIWPAVSGESPPGKAKTTTWDFARLLIRNRSLFQADSESALTERLKTGSEAWTFDQLQRLAEKQAHENTTAISNTTGPSTPSKRPSSTPETQPSASAAPPLLKHFPTILLLSAYLSSHTPAKNDIVIFSRLSSSTKRIRKRAPKKSIFKSPSNTPRKNTTSDAGTSTPSGSMTKNMLGRTRTLFDLKFGAPKAFSLERVLAVMRAVHPDGFKHTRSVADRVYREMGELERLRLVERVSAEDEVEGGGRWKIGVGREVVQGMLEGWGVKGGIEEWELQGDD